MPKRVFWPVAMVTMGLIFLASNLGLLPRQFWNLWPVILIIVGLGGLLTSDNEDWDGQPRSTTTRAKTVVKSAPAAKKKPARKK